MHNVSLSFGGIQALTDVSFDLPKGVVGGLIGPNGAGKTSLFNCVTGFYAPSAGSIRFAGREVPRGRPASAAARGISRTFQNVGLVRGLSVEENILLGSYHRSGLGFAAAIAALPGVSRAEKSFRRETEALLDEFQLLDVRHELVQDLPFGSRKRIELARAIISRPRLLLLDEPANGLVQDEVAELGETIRRVVRDRHIDVLLVEHNMGLVMSTCEHIIVLNFGRVIAAGDPQAIQGDAAVIEAYLGATR